MTLRVVPNQETAKAGQRWGNPVSGSVIEQAKLGSPNCNAKGTWPEFYKGRDTGSYRAYVARQYGPFIVAVQREVEAAENPESVLEVGCGIGTITRILTGYKLVHRRNTYLGLDRDPMMREIAQRVLEGRARVLQGDIRYSGWLRADIIHGHGVLEHLDDLGIYLALEAHKRSGARVAIHYVPGDLHGTPSFGDERLMSIQWWVNKWEPDEHTSFNGGRDYVLTWRF